MVFEITTRKGRDVVAEAATLGDARRACEVLVDEDGYEAPLDIYIDAYGIPIETYHGGRAWTTTDLARAYR